MPAPRSSSESADVRMRGFTQRTSVDDAQAWIDAHAARQDAEIVPLSAAFGRVLASDVTSGVDVPGFDRAMMDGFALRADDLTQADELKVVGESFPGRPFDGRIEFGQAVRIMTGAPIPDGADAVVPVEQVQHDGPRIVVVDKIPRGKHVGTRGEDVHSGQVVLAAGRCLRPQDVGVLSSIGAAEIAVVRRPRVRVVVTGNELLPPGSRPEGQQIVDANSPMLLALVERDGGLGECPGVTPDDRNSILAALEADADVVLVSGGTSVGAEDFGPLLLRELGELPIHGIAMRPGGPAGIGRLGAKLVFLLPGNPVSCLCAYDYFAGRAVRLLGGQSADWPYTSTEERLTRPIASVSGRRDYIRVAAMREGIEPLTGGASSLTTATRADGFVMVPDGCEGYADGDTVKVWWYAPRVKGST